MGRRDMTAMWPLVGRDAQLAGFDRAWASQRLSTFFVHGPAGVGKSRLADAWLDRIDSRKWIVVRVTASAAAAMVPLGAIAHLIPAGVDLSDPVRGFAQVASALTAPGQRRPWAVLVDDLHLLDAASAVLLRQLLDARLVRLVATVRAGEALGDAVQALSQGDTTYRVDLDILEPELVDRLLQAALGGPVERGTLAELYTVSGGNVLYLRELVLGVLVSGALRYDGEIWQLDGPADQPVSSPRLAELIGRRLGAAPPAGRAVLELLAVAEPLSLVDAQAAGSTDVLVELEQAGLIRVSQDRRRTSVRLAHPLYGEVLRDEIPTLRRRALLLDQAARWEAYGLRRRDDALRLATWRLTATGTAETTLLAQAAVVARYAHDYPRVIGLLEAIPEDAHTHQTWLLKGESHFELLEFDPAEYAFARAQRLAVGMEQQLAVVMERTQSLFWGAAHVEEALKVNADAMAGSDNPIVRDVLRVNGACMRIFMGELTDGLDALSAIDRMPDPRVRLYGVALKSSALEALGRAGQAIRITEEAYEEHTQVATSIVIQPAAWQLIYLSLACTTFGDLGRATAVAAAASAEAALGHAPLPRVHAAFALGWSSWLAGHVVTARRGFAEAMALHRKQPILGTRVIASGLAASCALVGDLAAAQAALDAIEEAPIIDLWEGQAHLGRAWWLAARGELGPARDVLTEAAQAARDAGLVAAELVLLTDVARLGGASQVAGRLAEIAADCEGPFAPARAHLAAALAADDPVRLLAAADELEAVGADLLAAEAAAAAGAALRRANQTRPATAATARAEALASRCEGARTPLLALAGATVPLSAREREVALLAAGGATSKQIATALTLSVRTVDNHLMRIYAKLGVSTRRELARALGSHPPGDAR